MNGPRNRLFFIPAGNNDGGRGVVGKLLVLRFFCKVATLLEKGNEKEHLEVEGYKKEYI